MKAAFIRARQIAQGKNLSDSEALNLIVLSFMSHNDFAPQDDETRDKFMAQLERAMSCKLVAINNHMEVTYGLWHLDEMASKSED